MMKRDSKHLALLGTLSCLAALLILWMAVLTVDWVSIQEPQIDQTELDKLGPYEEPTPHLLRAKFGLFKMCVEEISRERPQSLHLKNNQSPANKNQPIQCYDLDWYKFKIFNMNLEKKPLPITSELIRNCIQKLKFTLPFIGLSVLFTSISFLCLIFGNFCEKNKKIIEASMLILGGLCQATSLLSFVSQIGSEFEANLPFSHDESRLTTFYRYKYGYSFYLFLLSFGLSELGAFFDMLAYFRKYPPSQFVITFTRQETGNSPFLQPQEVSGVGLRNDPTYPQFIPSPPHHFHPHGNFAAGTLSKYRQAAHGPDICSEFSEQEEQHEGKRVNWEETAIPPPQSYINTHVTITTIDRGTGTYGTLKNTRTNQQTMESFGTVRKESNIN